MSSKIPSLTAAGVTAVGVLWGATRSVAEPQDAPPMPVPPAARPGSPAPSEASRPTVLLLSDGRILQGEIVEDPTGYFLKHKIGVKHFTRRNVLGTFRSLDEVYRFKAGRVPEDDPDEQMKLALWCLEQKLNEPAQKHLTQVLQLSPDNARARSMLLFLADRGLPPGDPAVARTGGDTSADPAAAPASLGTDAGMPRELPRKALDEIRNADRERRRQVGPPVIFDLPPAVAMKRYEEFSRVVHLKLQTHCARCHDADTHPGAFRLVKATARRDLTNDLLLRTNLDATLQLVNPDDPAHSELLSVAALTHPPDGRPVLGGPNHPDYRVLQAWIAGMSRPTTSAPATTGAAAAMAPRLQPVPASDSLTDGFAVGRPGGAPAAAPPDAGPAPITATPRVVAPSGTGAYDIQGLNVQGEAVAPGVPIGTQFPEPGLPKPAGGAGAGAGAGQVITQPDGTQAIRLPNGELVPFITREATRAPRDEATAPAVAPDPAPAAPAQAPAPAAGTPTAPAAPMPAVPPAGTDPAAAAARKKSKIDPNALQKFLQNRGGR